MRRPREIWNGGGAVNDCSSSVGLFGLSTWQILFVLAKRTTFYFPPGRKFAWILGFRIINSIKLNILTAETSVFHSRLL